MSADLKKALDKVGAQPVKFAYIIGKSGKEVVVSKKAHDDTHLKAVAAEKVGGLSKAVKGVCKIENDVLMFITKGKPGTDWLKEIKKVANKVGFRGQMDIRSAKDGEATEDEGPDTGTTDGTATEAPEGFMDRLKALLTTCTQRLQAGTGTDQMKLLAFQANTLVSKKDFAKAVPVVEALEKLLNASVPESTAAPTSKVAPPKGEFVAYTQSRLVWDGTQKKVRADIAKLQKAILDDFKGEAEFEEAAEAARELETALTKFDTKLIDTLDKALNAKTPEERKALHNQAAEQVAKYRAALDADDVLKELDTNPFVPVNIYKLLDDSLKVLQSKLKPE
jgi:hypothetical protein